MRQSSLSINGPLGMMAPEANSQWQADHVYNFGNGRMTASRWTFESAAKTHAEMSTGGARDLHYKEHLGTGHAFWISKENVKFDAGLQRRGT